MNSLISRLIVRKNFNRNHLLFFGILIFGIGLRLYYLRFHLQAINSDEAIIGLMARHILQGELPVFYYGQPYYGPVDAYLTAPIFSIFGADTTALRVVPFVASILFIFLISNLGKEFYSSQVGLLSGAVAAIPPVYLTTRGLKSDAAYILVLVLGTISLSIFHKLMKRNSRKLIGLLFFVWGLGLWIFPLFAYFVLAQIITWILISTQKWDLDSSSNKPVPRKQNILLLIISLIVLAVITSRLYGQELISGFLQGIFGIFITAGPILLGLMPRGIDWGLIIGKFSLGNMVVYSMVGMIIVLFLYFGLKKGYMRRRQGPFLLFVYVSMTLLVYISVFILLGVSEITLIDPRFLFPLYAAIPLWVDAFIEFTKTRPKLQILLILGFLGWNLYGNLSAPVSGNKLEPLEAWFNKSSETQYIYTDYWTGYMLAFESQENVIPFIINDNNRPGSNRYTPYRMRVLQAENPSYVFQTDKPAKEDFQEFLDKNDLAYQVQVLDNFIIYNDLSQTVYFLDEGLSIHNTNLK